MTDETANRITYDASNSGSLFMANDQIQAIPIQQPPTIALYGDNHALLIAVHPDGRLEYGPDYEPDEAARRFWEGVEQHARTIQYGAPMNAQINAHLKAGEEAEKRLKAVTEAVVLWRGRPGGDVGLAIALAGILDTEQPEPPAATALVRVLKECDRIEREVRANPQGPDFDGAYLACLRHIREAASTKPKEA